MIAALRGTVLEVAAGRAVVDVGGVGFEVQGAARTLARLARLKGEEARLHTYLHVRDDALQLFGFESSRERDFFLTLIGVSGVGPKVALAILSGYPVEELETAVLREDAKKFESIPGIGRKLAQRLIVELKDVVGEVPPAAAAGLADAVDPLVAARSALQNLGLTLREAEEALRGAPVDSTVEELVKFALARGGTEAS